MNNHLKRFVAVKLTTLNNVWVVWERIKLHPTVLTRKVAAFYHNNPRKQAQGYARRMNEEWAASYRLKQNKKAWRRWEAKNLATKVLI